VTATTAALGPLFAPRGVAVVGASRDAGELGAVMARSLAGFGGRMALVNPRDPGMYPSAAAAAADGPVDLAVLCLPAAVSAAALEPGVPALADPTGVAAVAALLADSAGRQQESAAATSRPDVRIGSGPWDEAAAMAGELAGRALLDGWRGGPVLDRAAFGRLVAGLGDLLLTHPHLQDVEINRCGSPRADLSRSTL